MEANAMSEGTSQTLSGHRSQRIKIAAGVAAVLALVIFAKTLHVQEHLLALVTWIRDAGWFGLAIFTLAYVAATVLFLPGSIRP